VYKNLYKNDESLVGVAANRGVIPRTQYPLQHRKLLAQSGNGRSRIEADADLRPLTNGMLYSSSSGDSSAIQCPED
jgi:hypothetical protein